LKHKHLSFQKEIGWQFICQPEIYKKAAGGIPAASLRMFLIGIATTLSQKWETYTHHGCELRIFS